MGWGLPGGPCRRGRGEGPAKPDAGVQNDPGSGEAEYERLPDPGGDECGPEADPRHAGRQRQPAGGYSLLIT